MLTDPLSLSCFFAIIQIVEESESESSSDEEEPYDDEFDVKWMRLKVPLAHQDPDNMKDMVDKGNEL